MAHHMCQLAKFKENTKEAKNIAKIKEYESYDRINFTCRGHQRNVSIRKILENSLLLVKQLYHLIE